MKKDYYIIANFSNYSAIVIQLTKSDLVFKLKEVAEDLNSLGIEGPILFDRLLITGDKLDRFSYNYIYGGAFMNDGLKVVSSANKVKEYKTRLEPFYRGVAKRLEIEEGIDVLKYY